MGEREDCQGKGGFREAATGGKEERCHPEKDQEGEDVFGMALSVNDGA